MIWILVLIGVLLFAIILVNVMGYENKIIEKAQEKKHRAMFYHVLAKLTCLNYKGYDPNEVEKKVMEEFLKEPSEYDKHPIGSYFKMCDENKKMLQSVARPSYNKSDLGIGFTCMLVFVITIILGVTFS